jgi:hypothetical protein
MADADERIRALVEKWLASLAAHARYAELTDEAYWQVQPWAPHERPNRWIVELALNRTRALSAEIERRHRAGDTGFAEALEAMAFVANLAGIEHIARYIPLADPANERSAGQSPDPPRAPELESTRQMPRPAAAAVTDTREMPVLSPGVSATGTPRVTARTEKALAADLPRSASRRDPPPAPTAPARPAAPATAVTPAPLSPLADDTLHVVIADAIRLRKWGREWHELASTISRMAGRPALEEVRRILRTHKADIEAGIARPRRQPDR